MKGKHNPRVARMRLALGEQRRELELSRRYVSELSGVSTSTLARIENGGPVRDKHVVAVARTLAAFELYALPALDVELTTAVRETPAPTVFEWSPLPAGSAA